MHAFLTRVLSLCLLRILCDMLLPEGDVARFTDLGISLLLLLSILDAIQSLFEELPL